MMTYGADTIPIKRRTQGLAIYGLSGLIPISFAGYLGDTVIAAAGFSRLFLVPQCRALPPGSSSGLCRFFRFVDANRDVVFGKHFSKEFDASLV